MERRFIGRRFPPLDTVRFLEWCQMGQVGAAVIGCDIRFALPELTLSYGRTMDCKVQCLVHHPLKH